MGSCSDDLIVGLHTEENVDDLTDCENKDRQDILEKTRGIFDEKNSEAFIAGCFSPNLFINASQWNPWKT